MKPWNCSLIGNEPTQSLFDDYKKSTTQIRSWIISGQERMALNESVLSESELMFSDFEDVSEIKPTPSSLHRELYLGLIYSILESDTLKAGVTTHQLAHAQVFLKELTRRQHLEKWESAPTRLHELKRAYDLFSEELEKREDYEDLSDL
jgi:hypothetical protein